MATAENVWASADNVWTTGGDIARVPSRPPALCSGPAARHSGACLLSRDHPSPADPLRAGRLESVLDRILVSDIVSKILLFVDQPTLATLAHVSQRFFHLAGAALYRHLDLALSPRALRYPSPAGDMRCALLSHTRTLRAPVDAVTYIDVRCAQALTSVRRAYFHREGDWSWRSYARKPPAIVPSPWPGVEDRLALGFRGSTAPSGDAVSGATEVAGQAIGHVYFGPGAYFPRIGERVWPPARCATVLVLPPQNGAGLDASLGALVDEWTAAKLAQDASGVRTAWRFVGADAGEVDKGRLVERFKEKCDAEAADDTSRERRRADLAARMLHPDIFNRIVSFASAGTLACLLRVSKATSVLAAPALYRALDVTYGRPSALDRLASRRPRRPVLLAYTEAVRVQLDALEHLDARCIGALPRRAVVRLHQPGLDADPRATRVDVGSWPRQSRDRLRALVAGRTVVLDTTIDDDLFHVSHGVFIDVRHLYVNCETYVPSCAAVAMGGLAPAKITMLWPIDLRVLSCTDSDACDHADCWKIWWDLKSWDEAPAELWPRRWVGVDKATWKAEAEETLRRRLETLHIRGLAEGPKEDMARRWDEVKMVSVREWKDSGEWKGIVSADTLERWFRLCESGM
ncbi:hypothetical protein Q5752_006668 [Cryptotrichosporon argae]